MWLVGEICVERIYKNSSQMGMLEMKSMILKMKNFLHRLNSNWDEKEKMISASRQGKKKKSSQRETPRQKSRDDKNK